MWGRGPLMNALPAIKTCNLVVQMVLENAQMSIAGLYNMDDDGAVNVDTIELVPGTIIPRAPGSRGIEAVQAGGRFDVAGLVLDEQRANIKRALYNDMLGNPNRTPMSATEVAERMADLSRQIGSAFGRLMGEFIFPVIQRVVFILKDLGTIKLPVVNGREVKVIATSPLARAQDQEDIMNVDRLIVFVQKNFGPQMVNLFIKGEDVTPYVSDKLGVPSRFVRKPQEIMGFTQQLSEMGSQVPGMSGEAGIPDLAALAAPGFRVRRADGRRHGRHSRSRQRRVIKVPAYPRRPPLAWCVCGSWPGGKCFKCPLANLPTPRQLFWWSVDNAA